MSKRCCASQLDSCLDSCLDSKVFKALGDPNRIALLCRLAGCSGPCGVTELSACCPIDLSVVSRHLACLHDAGLIERTRHGREIRYSVRCGQLAENFRSIAEALDACAASCSEAKGNDS